jgi:hypothetical protein
MRSAFSRFISFNFRDIASINGKMRMEAIVTMSDRKPVHSKKNRMIRSIMRGRRVMIPVLKHGPKASNESRTINGTLIFKHFRLVV